MSALPARLFALALFLLWNFHAGLHFVDGHCHEPGHDHGSTYTVAEHEDCGACHLGVAPGLFGLGQVDQITPEAGVGMNSIADFASARLFACPDGRGPPHGYSHC